MAEQIRQTEMCWKEGTEEYQVKLFINGSYQFGADYFTDDLEDAIDTAEAMQQVPKPPEDFCKEETKKQEEIKNHLEERIGIIEWPIHDETGELIGWLELEKDNQLPQVLCIQDQAYVQIKLSRLACSTEKKREE